MPTATSEIAHDTASTERASPTRPFSTTVAVTMRVVVRSKPLSLRVALAIDRDRATIPGPGIGQGALQ